MAMLSSTPERGHLLPYVEKHPGEVLANPTMDRRAIVAHIGKLWTALSELEKAPYVAGSLCDRQRLEEIKATWIDHPPKEPVNAFMVRLLVPTLHIMSTMSTYRPYV